MQLPDHKKTCRYRAEQCRFCLRTVKHVDLALHESQCSFAPKECPQHCGAVLQLQQVEGHIDTECPNTIVDCPFSELGCNVAKEGQERLTRAASNAHANSAIDSHLSLVVRALREERKKHAEEVKELKDALAHHQTRVLAELSIGDAPLANALSELQHQVSEQQRIIDRFTSGGTLTVDPSGCGAFKTISEAVANCNEGDMILVRAGTYKESFVLSKKGVWIHGAGMGRTIIRTAHAPIHLSGENIALSSLTVITTSRVAPAIRCSGPNPVVSECEIQAKTLSCVVVADGAPKFVKCKISGSEQHGIWWKSNMTPASLPASTSASGTSPTGHVAVDGGRVERCEVFGCGQSNISVESGELTISHGKIFDSWVNGVSVRKRGTTCKLSEVELYCNAYSNIDVVEGGAVIVDGCVSHHSGKCGLCIADGKGSITDSTFYANALPNVVLLSKSQTLFQGTVIKNGQQHGLVAKAGSIVTLKNCKIEGNSLENTVFESGSQVSSS